MPDQYEIWQSFTISQGPQVYVAHLAGKQSKLAKFMGGRQNKNLISSYLSIESNTLALEYATSYLCGFLNRFIELKSTLDEMVKQVKRRKSWKWTSMSFTNFHV